MGSDDQWIMTLNTAASAIAPRFCRHPVVSRITRMAQAPGGPCFVELQDYRLWAPKNYDVAHKNPPKRGDSYTYKAEKDLYALVVDLVADLVP